MTVSTKPLRMADLKGKIHRCLDEKKPEFKPRATSFTSQLKEMAVGDQRMLPKSTSGTVPRVAREMGFRFSINKIDEDTVLVTRKS